MPRGQPALSAAKGSWSAAKGSWMPRGPMVGLRGEAARVQAAPESPIGAVLHTTNGYLKNDRAETRAWLPIGAWSDYDSVTSAEVDVTPPSVRRPIHAP